MSQELKIIGKKLSSSTLCKIIFTGLVFSCFLLTPSLSFCWTAKGIGISDGDTITILREKTIVKIRLYGIDTPERKQAFGARAKQFTSDFCFGKIVDVDYMGTDRYGRTIALVRLEDERTLNEELIRAGFAWVYGEYCKRNVCLRWIGIEDEAKAEGRGLWKDKNPVPPWEFRRKRRQ